MDGKYNPQRKSLCCYIFGKRMGRTPWWVPVSVLVFYTLVFIHTWGTRAFWGLLGLFCLIAVFTWKGVLENYKQDHGDDQ